jgi:hypothetical protein
MNARKKVNLIKQMIDNGEFIADRQLVTRCFNRMIPAEQVEELRQYFREYQINTQGVLL